MKLEVPLDVIFVNIDKQIVLAEGVRTGIP